jgi:4-hydroxybenzoate polyprenyltransferase
VTLPSSSLNSIYGRVKQLIRAGEWWSYKLPLALGVAYALAFRAHLNLISLWFSLALIVICGTLLAIFASVFNDFIDQKEDKLAGKTTGLMSLSASQQRLVLTALTICMASAALLLSRTPLALLIYLLIWLDYTLYSLPPFRLKVRGIWGILSIATGEHVLASLFAVALLAESSHCPVSFAWLAALSGWSMAYGCRGILWHQLCDYENDRLSGTRTLGAVRGPQFLKWLGERVVFPLELTSLMVFLVLSQNVLIWPALLVSALLECSRVFDKSVNLIVVAPAKNFRIAMVEFYQLFFPLAFLDALVERNPSVIMVVAAQVLLFPWPLWHCLRYSKRALLSGLRRLRYDRKPLESIAKGTV